MDIREIHINCLVFLLGYQKEHPGFYFMTRQRSRNQIESGLYFIGNRKYLTISFWNSRDRKEEIYRINVMIESNGRTSIILSSRDDETKSNHLTEIKNKIETADKKYNAYKGGWRYSYPEITHYLDALYDFVSIDKPIIDVYVQTHPECEIPCADKSLDDKFVKPLPVYPDIQKVLEKPKKTGEITVSPSEYVMRFPHNQLSDALVCYLKCHGYTSVISEEDYVDIKAIDSDGRRLFFELKIATSAKYAIRQALGQLLEYNFTCKANKADKLIIVSGEAAQESDKAYLNELRNAYKLPIYYRQFSLNDKMLYEEC